MNIKTGGKAPFPGRQESCIFGNGAFVRRDQILLRDDNLSRRRACRRGRGGGEEDLDF